jgi:hypothetical protein
VFSAKATKPLSIIALMTATLAGCGDLPRPFMGNPGANALRLSRPPPSRLAIPPPTEALLTDDAGTVLAKAVAEAMVEQTVPAFAGKVKKDDWRLVMTAQTRGDKVVPTYTVQNPDGVSQGSEDGPPIPAADWAAGDPATLKAAAAAAAPGITALLNRIEAAIQQSDPNSLVNRPARIQIGEITGAPGDGKTSLARQLRLELTNLGEVVQDNATGADFIVSCRIATAPEPSNTTRIEIQWIVNDAAGPERGRVIFLNEIPTGTLDTYWGDVAVVVAEQSAAGIREVILNQLVGRQKPEKPPDG